jgi:NAD(P)-dependent dehydrogenase (short-subunit alcohol dehydrogenase family)
VRGASPHAGDRTNKSDRFGRLGRITDIAPLAVFLASDESAWFTGEVIRAAGGLIVTT